MDERLSQRKLRYGTELGIIGVEAIEGVTRICRLTWHGHVECKGNAYWINTRWCSRLLMSPSRGRSSPSGRRGSGEVLNHRVRQI